MKQFKILKSLSALLLFFILATTSFAQENALRKQLRSIIAPHDAIVGFSLLNLENGDTITINGAKHLPMQSVFKFHLALAVLHQVDQGKLKLNQMILVSKKDLLPELIVPLVNWSASL